MTTITQLALGTLSGAAFGAAMAWLLMHRRYRDSVLECERIVDRAEAELVRLRPAALTVEKAFIGRVRVDEHRQSAVSYFEAYRHTPGGRINVKRAYYCSKDKDARDYAELYITEVADKLNEEP